METEKVTYLEQLVKHDASGYVDISIKKQIYQSAEEYFGGKFTSSYSKVENVKYYRLSIFHKNIEILLSESDFRPLKIEINFNTFIDYKLIIGVEDFFSKLIKKIGKKDIEIGNENFDNKYLIESNNPEITYKLLSNNLCNKILEHEIYSISYISDKKSKTSKFISGNSRTIDNKEIFIDLINLHKAFIDNLIDLKILANI